MKLKSVAPAPLLDDAENVAPSSNLNKTIGVDDMKKLMPLGTSPVQNGGKGRKRKVSRSNPAVGRNE